MQKNTPIIIKCNNKCKLKEGNKLINNTKKIRISCHMLRKYINIILKKWFTVSKGKDKEIFLLNMEKKIKFQWIESIVVL